MVAFPLHLHAASVTPLLQLRVGFAFFAVLSLVIALLCALVIARLKQCQRELEQAGERRELLEQSADVIWQFDAQGRVRFVNGAVERFLGYAPEVFMTLPLERLCTQRSQGVLKTLMACDAATLLGTDERPSPLELEFRRSDGSAVWMEISCRPLLAGGGAQGLVCAARDIQLRKDVERSLRLEKERLGVLVEKHADPLLVVDGAGRLLLGNEAMRKVYHNERGGTRAAVFGVPLTGDAPAVIDTFLSGQEPRVFEMRVARITWGGIAAHSVALREMTPRVHEMERLRASEKRFRTIAEYTNDCEIWIGPGDTMLYASPSCTRLTGYDLNEVTHCTGFFSQLIHPEDLPLWQKHMQEAKDSVRDYMDFRIFHEDGRPRWVCQTSQPVVDEIGNSMGLRCSLRDITKRKAVEAQLEHQTLHDPLTGIGNRLLCMDRILQGLQRAKRRKDYFYAVVFMGLDRFKVINESLGHVFGDKLLREVSSRLLACVRHLDTVARFSGDEFVLFLEELASPREAVQIVKRIFDKLREVYLIDGKEVQITVSMGVVLSPADYSKPDDLLRNANIAMYHAKEAGRDRFKIFNASMLEHVKKLMHLENDLRRGITKEEFYLTYQPIVSLADERLLGFEALLRWQHPEKGLVSPAVFIPMAEETGLIIDIGVWVLEQGCKALASWRREFPGSADLFLSVNISGKQFSQPGLVDVVKRALQEYELPPDRLKLEITETTVMENPELAAEKLQRLKSLGVTLSIDDFGTGYSSLAYLQRFPLDNLKIDISFVRMMESAPENIEIIKAIIDLAHTLGLDVVAEGVENKLQQQTLLALGCEYAQGFYFSHPVDMSKAREIIRAYGATDKEALRHILT